MAADFDPYYKWLAIPPNEQPPNHYRLLGVPVFTDDLDVIENAANQRIVHVRTFQLGEYSALSQKVLNEIARAKHCLLHPEKKSQYDSQLRLSLAPTRNVPRATAVPVPVAAPPSVAVAQPPSTPQISVRTGAAVKGARRKKPPVAIIAAGAAALLIVGYFAVAAILPSGEPTELASVDAGPVPSVPNGSSSTDSSSKTSSSTSLPEDATAEPTSNSSNNAQSSTDTKTPDEPVEVRQRRTFTGPAVKHSLTPLNTEGSNGFPWISPSGLRIYWTREGLPGLEPEIWTADRKAFYSQFDNVHRVIRGRHAVLTGDETEMFLLDDVGTISVVSRRSSEEPFTSAREIASLRNQPSVKSPWISSDGLTLVFQRASANRSETEFAVTTRATRGTVWRAAELLPLESKPSLTMTWPAITSDGLGLLFCRGFGQQPEIMFGQRGSTSEGFGQFERLEFSRHSLIGRSPRYCEVTGELFFSALSQDQRTWEVWVVKNFNLPR